MKTVQIYSLENPDTSVIRYVGKTKHKNLNIRLTGHWEKAQYGKGSPTKKEAWIKGLGKKPLIKVIEEVPATEWEFWEQYWISQFKTWGFQLVNGDGGGLGGHNRDLESIRKAVETRRKNNNFRKPGEYTPTEETKTKIAKSKIGDKRPNNFFNLLARKNQKKAVTGNIFRRGKVHENYEQVRKSRLQNGKIKSVSNGSTVFITGWEAAEFVKKEKNIKREVKGIYNTIYSAIKRQGTAYGYTWEFVKPLETK